MNKVLDKLKQVVLEAAKRKKGVCIRMVANKPRDVYVCDTKHTLEIDLEDGNGLVALGPEFTEMIEYLWEFRGKEAAEYILKDIARLLDDLGGYTVPNKEVYDFIQTVVDTITMYDEPYNVFAYESKVNINIDYSYDSIEYGKKVGEKLRVVADVSAGIPGTEE